MSLSVLFSVLFFLFLLLCLFEFRKKVLPFFCKINFFSASFNFLFWSLFFAASIYQVRYGDLEIGFGDHLEVVMVSYGPNYIILAGIFFIIHLIRFIWVRIFSINPNEIILYDFSQFFITYFFLCCFLLPFTSGGGRYNYGLSASEKAKNDLSEIVRAILAYEQVNKSQFNDKTGMVLCGKYLQKIPIDPWGIRYSFTSVGQGSESRVFSFGPDRLPGTSDDIEFKYKELLDLLIGSTLGSSTFKAQNNK